jgi:hypothetical protein
MLGCARGHQGVGLVDVEGRDGQFCGGAGVDSSAFEKHGESAPVEVGGQDPAAVDEPGQCELDEEDIGAVEVDPGLAVFALSVGEGAMLSREVSGRGWLGSGLMKTWVRPRSVRCNCHDSGRGQCAVARPAYVVVHGSLVACGSFLNLAIAVLRGLLSADLRCYG